MPRNPFRLPPGCIILCCVGLVVQSACVKLPRRAPASVAQSTHAAAPEAGVRLVPINSASREELERLPGVGPGLAARIVEHRERYGRFRRAEHLLLVRGISERRFLQLRAYVSLD